MVGGPDAVGHIFLVGLVIGKNLTNFNKMDDLYNDLKWNVETSEDKLNWLKKYTPAGDSWENAELNVPKPKLVLGGMSLADQLAAA